MYLCDHLDLLDEKEKKREYLTDLLHIIDLVIYSKFIRVIKTNVKFSELQRWSWLQPIGCDFDGCGDQYVHLQSLAMPVVIFVPK